MSQTPTGGAPPPLPPKTSLPAPKKRMHGCLIALIVAACLLIPIVGILAAIALPAYSDYTGRAKVSGAIGAAAALKWQVVEFHGEHGRCPTNADEGFAAGELTVGEMQVFPTLGETKEGRCLIELTLHDTRETTDGHRLRLKYDDDAGDWLCSSDLDALFLPLECRE